MINPYLASHIAGVSWGEMLTVLRTLETALHHLTDAVGGRQALIEDALLIIRDVISKPGQQPLLTIAVDLMRIIEKAATHQKPSGPPAGTPDRS